MFQYWFSSLRQPRINGHFGKVKSCVIKFNNMDAKSTSCVTVLLFYSWDVNIIDHASYPLGSDGVLHTWEHKKTD